MRGGGGLCDGLGSHPRGSGNVPTCFILKKSLIEKLDSYNTLLYFLMACYTVAKITCHFLKMIKNCSIATLMLLFQRLFKDNSAVFKDPRCLPQNHMKNLFSYGRKQHTEYSRPHWKRHSLLTAAFLDLHGILRFYPVSSIQGLVIKTHGPILTNSRTFQGKNLNLSFSRSLQGCSIYSKTFQACAKHVKIMSD